MEISGAFAGGSIVTLFALSSNPYVLYYAFLLAILGGVIAYGVFPSAEALAAETEELAVGPQIGDIDFPGAEADAAKIKDSVEMVRDLHAAINPGTADYSETDYNFAGIRGKIVKGKKQEPEHAEPPPDVPSDFGTLTELPPPTE